MAYDEELAHGIRELLAGEGGVTEKAMFGGLAFLVGGNMAVGISNTAELMVRVGRDATDDALARPHTRLSWMSSRRGGLPPRRSKQGRPQGLSSRDPFPGTPTRAFTGATGEPARDDDGRITRAIGRSTPCAPTSSPAGRSPTTR
jgi:TfoX N-terminal domain